MEKRMIRGIGFEKRGERNCPVFICEDCNKRIADHGMGIIIWNAEDSVAFVVHKACPLNNNRYYEMSEELDTFIYYLKWNSKIPNIQKEPLCQI